MTAGRAPRSTQTSVATVETLYRILAPAAVTSLVAVVVSDSAYAMTGTLLFSNLSAWLLLFGLAVLGLVLVVTAISLMGRWLARKASWANGGLLFAAFVVELVNFMIHNRDGWTAVVPTGLALSIVGAVLLLGAAWIGRAPLASQVS